MTAARGARCWQLRCRRAGRWGAAAADRVAHLSIAAAGSSVIHQPPDSVRQNHGRELPPPRPRSRQIRCWPLTATAEVLSSPPFRGFFGSRVTPFGAVLIAAGVLVAVIQRRVGRPRSRASDTQARRRSALRAQRGARARRSRPGLGAHDDAGHHCRLRARRRVDRAGRALRGRAAVPSSRGRAAGGGAGRAEPVGTPEGTGAGGDQGDGARSSHGQAVRRGSDDDAHSLRGAGLAQPGGARAGGTGSRSTSSASWSSKWPP